MENNGEVTCSRASEEIDMNDMKIESLEIDKNLDSGNLQDNLIATTRKYVVMPKRRGRPRKRKLEAKSQPPMKKTIDNATIDSESGLKRDRFRPIRPKPTSSAAPVSKNKLLEMSSTLNVPTLMSNRLIFTTPLLDRNKTQHTSTSDNFEKRRDRISENATDRNSNAITINNSLRNAKSTVKSQKSSIELFFESMAQTVLNLPMEVQADIKMQICKIVTNAEVKYCGSQTKFKEERIEENDFEN
ncbi:hypothetical protein DMN91_004328 [Ooceraea biroi]|uniref:Uncharacterized protein n=1 Tax=Ooceraea biroi TaxID=2015173 RepID=A0A026VVV1_OOCBI|nr:uncharacterized protein LOC105286157 [Ooceraea biroi]XP_011349192.1 uncharacterized protein LOC105286157 [Ooceraea biroi]EZA47795.1 hypothetical protein X777_15228 [Ooceraea biroi]RLU24119.1 hypothetical protein DMN91_004328 [Ooceraea biroi]